MKRLIVAGTKAHAAAMLRWCKFESEHWHTLCYGEPVRGVFSAALLVRPVGDITDDHALWVHEIMKPRIFGPIEAVPGWVQNTPDLKALSHEG